MEGDMGRKGGLTNPAPGVDNAVLVFQIPVGLLSLGRGRHVKKNKKIRLDQHVITYNNSDTLPNGSIAPEPLTVSLLFQIPHHNENAELPCIAQPKYLDQVDPSLEHTMFQFERYPFSLKCINDNNAL